MGANGGNKDAPSSKGMKVTKAANLWETAVSYNGRCQK
jgi:hypothetical protein